MDIQPLFQATIPVGINIPTQQCSKYEDTLQRFVPPRQPFGESNYFACLGADEELNDDGIECNIFPDCSDDKTVCVSNTTCGSDDVTMKMEEDNSTYAGKLSPLITNVADFCNPAPLPTPTQLTAGQAIVQANNLRELPMAAKISNTPKPKRAVHWDFSDSGATGQFLVEGAPVFNKQPPKSPIKFTLLNEKTIKSTHT